MFICRQPSVAAGVFQQADSSCSRSLSEGCCQFQEFICRKLPVAAGVHLQATTSSSRSSFAGSYQ